MEIERMIQSRDGKHNNTLFDIDLFISYKIAIYFGICCFNQKPTKRNEKSLSFI